MKIILITPAKKYSKNGNRTTALRWSKILRKLGHKVTIDIEYRGGKADLMIALHAWRSAESIKEFKHSYPSGKIIGALTGTDFNEFMHSHPETTLCSMEYANRLVCLHDQVARVLPRKFHSKLRVIYQSAVFLKKQYTKSLVYFDVCLVAHMRAVKDPDGANLDRVQVVKGWHDKKGKLHEKVYNVALSDGRKESRDGKAPLVGSTVNVEDASYINSIGDTELAVVWQDPDFDKNELAFYYVRVLEIPTPRWTAYDAKFFGIKDIPKDVPMVTQERAYTSPIWYTPVDK